jgi:hypothetical protein
LSRPNRSASSNRCAFSGSCGSSINVNTGGYRLLIGFVILPSPILTAGLQIRRSGANSIPSVASSISVLSPRIRSSSAFPMISRSMISLLDTKVSFTFAQQFQQRGKVQPTRPQAPTRKSEPRSPNYLNVGKTSAQSHRDDQKYCDHTEISEPLSNGRMLPHWGDCEIVFLLA